MDLSFSPQDEAFRQEVLAFIAEAGPKLPPRLGPQEEANRSKEDYLIWHRLVHARGWAAPSWPKAWGGAEWSVTQRYIFTSETAKADMPMIMPFGISMVGQVIIQFGTEAQKKKFLPPMLSGDHWWCQGYSEPGAGSDLASLRTKAVLEGDHYVVNGQKIWTTLAQYADWIFCLVRTDPAAKPQAGISFLLMDMKTPGITVKPITVLDGANEVNEVFFDNVKVPVENLIGEENKGWTYAKYLLEHERSVLCSAARSRATLERLKKIARDEMLDGVPLIETPDFARKLWALEADLLALEFTELRHLNREAHGEHVGAESSILKIVGSETQQRVADLTMEAVGYYALPDDRALGDNEGVGPEHALGAAGRYFNLRKTTIYGGSNEIQRNILAKAVLGL